MSRRLVVNDDGTKQIKQRGHVYQKSRAKEWNLKERCSEMQAGRIVNAKTRERIGERTINSHRTAIAYLNGIVGSKLLATLDNSAARDLVARMKDERKENRAKRFSDSNKTLNEYFKTFCKIIKSAVDANGNQIYPRTWNLLFIGLPKVNGKKQHRPTLDEAEMNTLLETTRGRYQMGSVLLAGSSVRISELLALRIERHISKDRKTVHVEEQRRKNGQGVTDVLKTPASGRDIDLCSALAEMLDVFIGPRTSGYLIQTKSGKMMSPENFWRDGLRVALRKMGRTRVRFHAFRRFRESVLKRSQARDLLIDYWMGHENQEMGSRYAKQLLEDVKWRKEWDEKVGLGFQLPPIGIQSGIREGKPVAA